MLVLGPAIWKPVQTRPLELLFGGVHGARLARILGMSAIGGCRVAHLTLVVLVPPSFVAMITGRQPGHAR